MRHTTQKARMTILQRWDHWDGPLSGVCLYEGRVCYYDTAEVGGWITDDCWSPRVWRLYRMTWRQYIESCWANWLCKAVFRWQPIWAWQMLNDIPRPEHEEQIYAHAEFEGWPK